MAAMMSQQVRFGSWNDIHVYVYTSPSEVSAVRYNSINSFVYGAAMDMTINKSVNGSYNEIWFDWEVRS